MPGRRLELPRSLREAIGQAAQSAYPEECCGLLLGRPLAGGAGWQATSWLPARNIHPEPRRHFELDPAVHIALLRRLRGLPPGEPADRLIGHVHSHPDTPAKPSATDRAMAFDENLLWLIIAIPDNHLTAWQPPPDASTNRDFREIAISVTKENTPYAEKS